MAVLLFYRNKMKEEAAKKETKPNEIIVKDINISDSGEMSNNTLAQNFF